LEREQLVRELNKILLFEHGHLGIYAAQAKRVKDREIARAFDRFKHLEEEHAGKIVTLIRDLGGSPSLPSSLGDEGGKILGVSLSLTGIENILRADMIIEATAYKNYHKLYKKITDETLRNRLGDNMIDAHLMYLWLKDRLETGGTLDPEEIT